MLELREYTKAELSAIFSTNDMQGLKRKLQRYGIRYQVQGRGERAIFTILETADPFKVFCISELGYDGGTDFQKLRNFLYLSFEGISTHSFRKWYATEIYKANGFDIALVQRLLQHSSAATTQRYIGIEPQRIEEAIQNHTQLI